MQKTDLNRKCQAFSMTELLVVMTILGVLVALVFSGLLEASRKQKAVSCLATLKQYGTALNLFIAENEGLPWWDGKNIYIHNDGTQSAGSQYPNFEIWVRPYLNYQVHSQRLRCPAGSKSELKQKSYAYNYSGNSSLCFAFPKVQTIPVPHSRVVLAAECLQADQFGYAVQMNMTMWATSEAIANNKTAGVSEFKKYKNGNPNRAAQYHGPDDNPGMNLFFLDGHVELVAPPDGNWYKSPTYATTKQKGGLFYDRGQFNALKQGQVFP